MSAIQEVVTAAPAVEAVPKKALTLGAGASLAMLALLLIVPLFVKNFIIFQMTMLLIYALAVLALVGTGATLLAGANPFDAAAAHASLNAVAA